jgi:hypothetical protein
VRLLTYRNIICVSIGILSGMMADHGWWQHLQFPFGVLAGAIALAPQPKDQAT